MEMSAGLRSIDYQLDDRDIQVSFFESHPSIFCGRGDRLKLLQSDQAVGSEKRGLKEKRSW